MPSQRNSQPSWFSRYWSYLAVALLGVIATSAALTWARFPAEQPIEISIATPTPPPASIYVGGGVFSPGYYPLKPGDRIEDILREAGGAADNASRVSLWLAAPGEVQGPQKVDINSAPLWLLQALPGIGEVRAQAIVRYREQNGGFKSTAELARVDGISSVIYERIKDLITVYER